MMKKIILFPFYVLGAAFFYAFMGPLMLLSKLHMDAEERRLNNAADESNEIWELLRVQAITRDVVENHPAYPGQGVLRYKAAH